MNDMTFPIAFIVAVLLFGIGIIWGGAAAYKDIEIQAIERGYALYCPKDGKFAWKGECE